MNEHDERVLTEGLRALARKMEVSDTTPPRVDESLRREFRRHKLKVLGRRATWFAGTALAAAVAWLLLVPAPAPRREEVAARVGPAQVAPAPTPKREEIDAPRPTQRVARQRPSNPLRVAQGQPMRRAESFTRFLPVPGGDLYGPLDSGSVVRVELPRSAMTTYGIPVNRDRLRETVQADVVLGEDGLARAIRFVQ